MSVWARLQSLGREEWALEFYSNKKVKYTVGRHPSCSLVLEGICVSSKHLSIYQRYAPDGSREVVAEDSSTNGSWIDGVRLSRGAIVPLKHGSKVQLPSDDDQCDNYTFKFIVHDELQSSAYQEPDEEQRREELKELETLQDQLAVDTSRLAASIFSNDATLRSLGALVERSQQQQAENRDLRQINRDLVSIIESMVTSMRQVEENVLTTKELKPNDQSRILGALKVDRFQLVLDELQTGAENRTVVDTDVETDTDEPTRRRLSTQSSVDTNVDAM